MRCCPWRLLLLPVLLACVLSACDGAPAAERTPQDGVTTITVDPSRRHQQITGWGTYSDKVPDPWWTLTVIETGLECMATQLPSLM